MRGSEQTLKGALAEPSGLEPGRPPCACSGPEGDPPDGVIPPPTPPRALTVLSPLGPESLEGARAPTPRLAAAALAGRSGSPAWSS